MSKNNWLVGDDPHPELSPDHPSGLGACIGIRNALLAMLVLATFFLINWAAWHTPNPWIMVPLTAVATVFCTTQLWKILEEWQNHH